MIRALLLLAFATFAASAAMPPVVPQFVALGVDDGLPSSIAYRVVQDADGFIWIGTQDGLARYDGVEYAIHRHDPADPASIGSNDVSAIVIDRQGRLWCGGEASGVNRLEADGRSFSHWRHEANNPATLGSNDVFTLAADASGAIWAGTYLGGLNRIDADGSLKRYDHDPEDPSSLRSNTVFVLHAADDGVLWVGTDEGLDLLHPDGRIEHVDLPQLASRGGARTVMSFLPEADGGLIMGTRQGIFRFDAARRFREEVLPQAPPLAATALVRDRAGDLWLGLSDGLMHAGADGERRYGGQEAGAGAYPGTRTMDILSDAEGGLWFALFDGGIARLPPHWRNFAAFRHVPGDVDSLQRPNVVALGVEDDRALWVASGPRGGIDRVDLASGRVERWSQRVEMDPRRPPLAVMVLPDRAGGSVWIGMRNRIAAHPVGSGPSVTLDADLVREDALPPGFVEHFRRASDGTVWVAVRGGGMVRMATEPPRVLRRYMPANGGLDETDINAFVMDRDGTPWIATLTGARRHDATADRFVDIEGIPHLPLTALAFGRDGSLWTHRLGVLEQWIVAGHSATLARRYDTQREWPAINALALTVDDRGDVWVTSPRGLWRLSTASGEIRRFDARDGLPSQEFVSRALAVGGDGVIFAGTLNGAVAFDPRKLETSLPGPPVHLTSVQVRRNGGVESLDPAAPVRLGHEDLDLRVQARVLSYANPVENRYQFRLAGYEQGWVDAARGERVWPQLPPGDYRLEVRAANADGRWTSIDPPLPVHVARTPWATPAAFAGYALMLLIAAWLALKSWRERLRRRHAYALAEEQRRATQELVEAKSAFLATMGHEIRTPMTGVLGMSELLLATPLDERQRAYATAIQQSGQMLLRLVNDSLDIARIDAGKLALDDRELDPVALVREVVAMQEVVAQAKGLWLRMEVAEGVPALVWGDDLRIKQILLNLVGNALKFTERGGVTLRLVPRSGDRLRFEVADTGPGMSAAVRERLFRRFEQGEGVLRRHGGSGLGLAICRDLALLMGGTITVSGTPGQGSTFIVDLPTYAVRNPPEPAVDGAPPVPPQQCLDVLLVEDDATVAEVIAGLLGTLGHRVRSAHNALAGLAELERARCDVALLDLDLPGIDGLKLARMLRTGKFAAMPLVAITARSVGDEEQHVRAAGMDALLRKPVTAALLRDAIAVALAARTERT